MGKTRGRQTRKKGRGGKDRKNGKVMGRKIKGEGKWKSRKREEEREGDGGEKSKREERKKETEKREK